MAGDPVVPLIVQKGTGADAKPRTEYVVVRLAEDGSIPVGLNLEFDATFGDAPVTALRIGPDGSLYQLRSDLRTGVSIARYSLGVVPTPSPVTASTTPRTQPSSGSSDPAGSGARSPAWWIGGGLVLAVVLAWWIRHRARRGRHRSA